MSDADAGKAHGGVWVGRGRGHMFGERVCEFSLDGRVPCISVSCSSGGWKGQAPRSIALLPPLLSCFEKGGHGPGHPSAATAKEAQQSEAEYDGLKGSLL